MARCLYSSYLEIGVQNGVNFCNVNAQQKIGVDPAEVPIHVHAHGQQYQMNSDDFFNINRKKFDLIFIDGLHHAPQVMRDFKNAKKFLSKHGTIVFHDCNPPTELHQVVPRQQKEWCGDVWITWARIVNTMPFDEIPRPYCIDTDFGVGIYSHHPALEREPTEGECLSDRLQFSDLRFNKNMLNLIDVEEWNHIVSKPKITRK